MKPTSSGEIDLAIVGAGAAGLMAAIRAGRTGRLGTILALDGARKLGAKILVSGGGRCNVTNEQVDARDFAGSTPNAIRKVLRRFDVAVTIAFFRDIGVDLVREETGKLFPATDRAQTVRDALLAAAAASGVRLAHPRRVETIRRVAESFEIGCADGETIRARRVILAAGGKSLPKSGSDGSGFEIARSLGHSTTPFLAPALVPLILPAGHFLRGLSGVSAPAAVILRSPTGRKTRETRGPILCAHFGVSGPAILDISRHFLMARAEGLDARLVIDWLPGRTREELDAALRAPGRRGIARMLGERLPERLARSLCRAAGVDPAAPCGRLTREERRSLIETLSEMPLPVTGDRGFAHAEATAGGVPLEELRLETMESRLVPGLYLCGEICDVDGRIGGFNFQWAWSSGHLAGVSAGAAFR